MGDKHEVSFDGTMQRDQAVEYLEALIQTLREGILHIEANGQQVTLHPTDVVTLEIEGSAKEDKEKFSIKLAWRKDAVAEKDPGLRISAVEPEPAPEAATAGADDDEN